MARLLQISQNVHPNGRPQLGLLGGYRRALQVALVGGLPVNLADGRALSVAVRGLTNAAGRSFSGTGGEDCVQLGTDVSLAGSFTSVALITTTLAGSNPGLWRSGASGSGGSFCINNTSAEKPWMRIAGADVFSASGESLPGAGALLVVAYRWVNAVAGSCWWRGRARVDVASGATLSADTLRFVGWQFDNTAKLGHLHGVLHFNAALPDALLARITASPAAFWAFAFNP
jgi:hypothetical protein